MLSRNKIVSSAIAYAKESWSDSDQFIYVDGFQEGVKWATSEFRKDLWHDINEPPEVGSLILLQYLNDDDRVIECHTTRWFDTVPWSDYIAKNSYGNWLYMDELL